MLESRSAYGYYGFAGGYTGETPPSEDYDAEAEACGIIGESDPWDDFDREEEYFRRY